MDPTAQDPPPLCSCHHFFFSLATTPFSISLITPWEIALVYGESNNYLTVKKLNLKFDATFRQSYAITLAVQ